MILYATDWLTPGANSAKLISLEDVQGLMGVCKGLRNSKPDVILHSPGGDPEAAASIVRYLRKIFAGMRAFVSLAAMSAATMWALASDKASSSTTAVPVVSRLPNLNSLPH